MRAGDKKPLISRPIFQEVVLPDLDTKNVVASGYDEETKVHKTQTPQAVSPETNKNTLMVVALSQ